MSYAYLVRPGDSVKLKDHDPDDHGGLEREEAVTRMEPLCQEIEEMQELLFATRETAMLCVFQAMDTAGKDGAINRVISYVNVQSCRVAYFKVPTPEELSHDFLWRVHRETPPLGGLTLFNRSHYEDVIVARVHNLVPERVWRARYSHINAFERLLSDSGTILLKFYLHISKGEQRKRLLAREKDPRKSWKLSVGDWRERELWRDYQKVYEDVLTECSTEYAPWRIVPANHKWFRDLAVAEALAEALRPFRKKWTSDLAESGAKAKKDLAEYRKSAGRETSGAKKAK